MLLSREAPVLHQHPLQALVIVLAYTLELCGTFRCLTTPYSMIVGHREIKLGLCCKFPSYWLAFIFLIHTWAAGIQLLLKVLLSDGLGMLCYQPCLARCAYWYISGMIVVGATYYLLIGFKPHSRGEDSYFIL